MHFRDFLYGFMVLACVESFKLSGQFCLHSKPGSVVWNSQLYRPSPFPTSTTGIRVLGKMVRHAAAGTTSSGREPDQDHYALLRVPRDATTAQIKQARISAPENITFQDTVWL